jgi:hypothetical protein
MKNLFIILSVLTLLGTGCLKDEFDPYDPDVDTFVNQLKKGTYNSFEKDENGENLWLQMPEFQKKHIQRLIELAKDTSHIKDFPINPISSRIPFPGSRDYFILGECLLWAVEGVRNDNRFGSLDPFLIDVSLPESAIRNGLKATEILQVREIYKNWWQDHKDKDWKNTYPLENTTYRWY